MLSLVLIFFFSLVMTSFPDAHALSIFDYASCKQIIQKLEDIGSYTYAAIFGNSETPRFCMTLFEKGIPLREIKDHHEIPQLGVQVEFPKTWSGFEIYDKNMTVAFVTPHKKIPSAIEPLWLMLVTNDSIEGEATAKKIYRLVEESLDDVPNFMNTCKFKESKTLEINDIELEEEIVECIDRRLSLLVTVSFYSFTVNETDLFLVSATRHVPSITPEDPIHDSLKSLKITKILNNIENADNAIVENKKSEFPYWFKHYVTEWGMGKITDRELISTLKFIYQNSIINDSHYSMPGFYNQAKIPDWFADNAIWFGKGLTTENEFKQSFKYLVENRIIII